MSGELATPSVFGRYELRSVLGRGGVGVVYEAVLVGLVGFRKRVALKVLSATDHHDPAARAALQREARLGALLSHPNVVSILDLGREQDQWFIAMELVDGHPLSALLRAGPLPPAAVVELGISACAGLGHIHELRVEGSPGGLVHRDVKPQNLLVDRNGTLKVADFGIAALVNAVGDRGGGTPTWMAPEQATGRATPQSDLFSLGAVLYALAARKTPFGVGAVAMQEAARVEARLADPAFLAPVEAAVPGLGPIVHRCLRLDPSLRPASASAVAAELRRLRPAFAPVELGEFVERVRPTSAAAEATTPRRQSVSASQRSPSLTAGQEVLVGRTHELDQLVDQVVAERLVTLTGAGGVGKTRLARELASRLSRSDVRRPTWVDVSSATEGGGSLGVVRLVGAALGLELMEGDPAVQLGAALAARTGALLVLDGAERAIGAVAQAVEPLLAAVPDLRVVVTSRLPLRSRSERVVPIEPLPPDDAASLFLARARGTVSDADRRQLPALVEALDGLPLAIELAAARTRTLTVPQVLERLRDRFKLLVDPAAPGSNAGLHSTLAASFELLKPWEARAVGELAVFAGGFTVEAAEAVVKLDAWPDAPWALDVVSALLDASLVSFDRIRSRFTMGHAVQEFALASLPAEVARAAQVRHGEYFSQLGTDGIEGSMLRSGGFLRLLAAELDNLRVATERAIARGDAGVASRTGYAAAQVYQNAGPAAMGAALLDQVLAMRDVPLRARMLVTRWSLRGSLGQRALGEADLAGAFREAVAARDDGRRLQIRALQLRDAPDRAAAAVELRSLVDEAHTLGDPSAEARAWNILGLLLSELEDASGARAALEEARRGFLATADRRGEGLATMRLGRLDRIEGRLSDALRRFGEAEDAFRDVEDRRNLNTTRENRAVAQVDAGAFDDAHATFEELLADARRYGDRKAEANLGANLGVLARRSGRMGEARTRFEGALLLARMGAFRDLEARVLSYAATLDAFTGRFPQAVAGWIEASAIWRALGLAAAADAADATRLVAEVAQGSGAPVQAASTLAQVTGYPAVSGWIDLAHAALERGDAAVAEQALAGAESARSSLPPRASTDAAYAVARARALVAAGKHEEAAVLLTGAERELREEAERAWMWIGRTELLLALRDRPRAQRALAGLEASVERSGAGPGSFLRRVTTRLAQRCAVDGGRSGG